MASKEMSDWLKFFTTAGIPPGPSLTYATLFVDNRMHINMLMDLTKEYLRDMGITVMGDIIAILKYAKTAHAEFERVKPALNPAVMKAEKVELKRQQTAGSRMLEHYMRKEGIEPEGSPKVSVSPAMAVRLGAVPTTTPSKGVQKTPSRQPAVEVVPVKRVRKVDPSEEGHYVIKMPKGTTPKTKTLLQKQRKVNDTSNVFNRLGKEVGAQIVVTGGAGDVFSRLGDVQSQRARSVSGSSEASVLEYRGVLKEGTPKPKPGITQEKTLTVKIPNAFKDKLAGLQRPEVTTTSPAGKSMLRGTKGVKARLGGKKTLVSTQKKVATGGSNLSSRVGQNNRVGQEPKVTVTLSGIKGTKKPQSVQMRLGNQSRAARFSPATFAKGTTVKTTKTPITVTMVSDKPKQKITMKERLGTFKAEASSTTPSFTVTNINKTRVKTVKPKVGKGLQQQRGRNQSVFSRLGGVS